MSLPTTLARAKARADEYEWKMHKRECPTCDSASRARKLAKCCEFGALLQARRRESTAELERERKLDAAPHPGQGTLC